MRQAYFITWAPAFLVNATSPLDFHHRILLLHTGIHLTTTMANMIPRAKSASVQLEIELTKAEQEHAPEMATADNADSPPAVFDSVQPGMFIVQHIQV